MCLVKVADKKALIEEIPPSMGFFHLSGLSLFSRAPDTSPFGRNHFITPDGAIVKL